MRNYLNAELDQQKFGNIFPTAVTFSTPPVPLNNASTTSPVHARPHSTPTNAVATSSVFDETYTRSTRKGPLNNPAVDVQYHSQMQTSHNALFNADNYLNSSPVTPKIPSRAELMHEHQMLSSGAGEGGSVKSNKLSYGELKSGVGRHNTVTPPTVKLEQMGYYNTQPKYSSSSGAGGPTSQRVSTDRSPPTKVTRSSAAAHTVTPSSTGLKLTKDMLTSEEVFSEERKTSSLLHGNKNATGKINPEMQSYEWNRADFA